MKKEILVIGRDEEVFEHIRDVLEGEMVGVSYTYALEDGLYRMRVHNYSLVVMAVALPEQSGREVLAAVRNLHPMSTLVLSLSITATSA